MGASRAAHVSRRRPSSPARETRVCRGAAIGRTGLSMRRMVTGLAVVALSLVGLVPASGLIATTTANTYWGVNGRVNAIVQTADTLYLGGSFTQATSPDGSQTLPRVNLVALDAATGSPRSWAPNPNKVVYDLALGTDGTRIFVAGDFTKIGNKSRPKVAALSTSTGALDSTWAPKPDSRVEALEVRGGKVYLGGRFLNINGIPRIRLAAVSESSGLLDLTWVPEANEVIHDISSAPDGRILVGGLFGSINGITAHRRLSALDPTTGAPSTDFLPRPAYETFDIDVVGNQVFTAAGGAGGHALAFDLTTGANQWVTFGDGDAESVQALNGVVYIGGHFDSWTGIESKKLVALDPVTGARINWFSRINSALGVFAIDGHGRNLAIGGDFTSVSGQNRNHFAVFIEANDTQPPTAPGTPTAIATSYTSATIGFAPASDNIANYLTYSIFRDGSATSIGTVTSTASSGTIEFTDDDLPMGTTHTYAVRASDGVNAGPLSAVSSPISTPFTATPVLGKLEALDVDSDGRLDRILATFSHDVSCEAPCTSPWTITGLPIGSSLGSVSVLGRRVALDIVEGSGPLDTTATSLRVTLAAEPVGVVDAEGDSASFPATPTLDRMGPVPVTLASADVAGTPRVMEPGDTFTVTFSEPIDPATVLAANVKQFDPAGVGNDGMNIVGLSSSLDLGSDAYITLDGGQATYPDATLTLDPTGATITSTIVGSCIGSACASRGPGDAAPVTFTPEFFLKDAVGNHATGSATAALGMY